MAVNKLFLVYVLFLSDFCLGIETNIENYCNTNVFAQNGTPTHFSKEVNDHEYAIVGKFKSLNCCSKNYRSIEWFKNNKPYPWTSTSSSLILYPESGNQTVYTDSISTADAGNYTCYVRSDYAEFKHTIILQVFDKAPEEPLTTFKSPNLEAAVGENVRLYCEAFAQPIDLPDAKNYVEWSKRGGNGTFNGSRITQEKTSRESHHTYGTYLMITNVQEEDFGYYSCDVKGAGRSMNSEVYLGQKVAVTYLSADRFPIETVLFFLVNLIILVGFVFVVNRRYGLKIRVYYKNTFGRLEENDGKKNDALIVYSEKDSDMVLGILLPRLESAYHYKCGCRNLPLSVESWGTDLNRAASESRRIIAVLSPSSLNDDWTTTGLSQAIKQLISLGAAITVIALQKLPVNNSNETKNAEGQTLKTLLNLVQVIEWTRPLADSLWLNLCLTMPPKRRIGSAEAKEAANTSRLTGEQENGSDLV